MSFFPRFSFSTRKSIYISMLFFLPILPKKRYERFPDFNPNYSRQLRQAPPSPHALSKTGLGLSSRRGR